MAPTAGATLPVVVIPVGVEDGTLDACLAALDVATPAGTRVWLADDAQGGPRVRAVVDAWLSTTRLQADYSRRPRSLGEAAHAADVLQACGDADVAMLAYDACPAPGWLSRMARCLADETDASTVTPWSNAGEVATLPRPGAVAAAPEDLTPIADALAATSDAPVGLPAAVGHAVLIRGAMRRAVGGIDGESYASWYAALTDLCLRMQAFGGRDLLCTQAYVARQRESRPDEGDLDRLAARWPAWNARLAEALMRDPLQQQRERANAAIAIATATVAARRQADLFRDAAPP